MNTKDTEDTKETRVGRPFVSLVSLVLNQWTYDGYVGSGAVRQVRARAGAAVLRSAGARSVRSRHAGRGPGVRDRQADAAAARAPAGARDGRHRPFGQHARRRRPRA